MKRYEIFIFLLLFFNLLISVDAAPYIFNPQPKNGTYIFGRDTDVFSVNITSSGLNASTAKLHIRVKDPTSIWQGVSLSCFNWTVQDWFCNATVAGLESLLADGKYLLYYFDANDTDGSYGYNGTADDPLQVLVDRSPPVVSFYEIQNISYVGENKPVKISIEDRYSGVNSSIAVFAYGNSSWNSSWQVLSAEEGYFIAEIDTLILPDNSSWEIYVNATDNVGNSNTTHLGAVLIDNEYPTITSVSPASGQGLYGEVSLLISGNELYSGICEASFTIDTISGSLVCSGVGEYNCTGSLDTTVLPDGNYTLTYRVSDCVGNVRNESISVEISNTFPIISVITPHDNSFVRGIVLVNISVGNVREIRSAKVKIETLGQVFGWVEMHCENTTCTYNWDASSLEGEYLLSISVVNEANYEVTESLKLTVDNTEPVITVTSPQGVVEGEVSLSIVVTDENGVDESSVEFTVANHSLSMDCNVFLQGKKLVCSSTLNSTQLADGDYTIYFSARDYAGNEKVVTQAITVANLGYAPAETTTLPVENKTEESRAEEGTTSEEGGESVFERIKKTIGSLTLTTALLLFLPLVSIPPMVIFLKPKRGVSVVVAKKIKNKLAEDRNSLQLIKNYINAASTAEDFASLKGFLHNLKVLVESVEKEPIIRGRFIQLAERNPKLAEALRPRFSRIEEKAKLVDQLKNVISRAFESMERAEVDSCLREASEICERLEEILREEFELLEKMKG